GRRGRDGAGQRVAAERTEAHALEARLLPRAQGEPVVVDHDERAITLHHGALRREVEGHDLDVLQVDVEPDVELGPVRQGERADALTLREAPVVEVPELRALVLGILLAVAIAERVDALLRAGALLVPACATECRVVAALAVI